VCVHEGHIASCWDTQLYNVNRWCKMAQTTTLLLHLTNIGVLESIIGLKLFASFLSTLMFKSADMHRVSVELNERMSNQEEQRLISPKPHTEMQFEYTACRSTDSKQSVQDL